LVDKWAIIRETAGGGKGLRVTYGTGKDQFVNPTMMYLDSLGNVGVGTTSPHSTLHVNGSLAMNIKSVAADYYVTDSDCILVVDAPDEGLGIWLPSAVGIAGRVYTFKYIGTSWAWLYPAASEQIDDVPGAILLTQWEHITVVSDGSNWLIIAHGA
jgi:hypothetical protein